jgi:hypothetical protein
MIDLQFFVPARAFFIQLGLSILGACVLLSLARRVPRLLLLGSAYPIGANLAGLVQWACFVSGRNHQTLAILGALFVVAVAGAAIRVIVWGPLFPSRVSMSMTSKVILGSLGVLCFLLSFLVTQSSDLAESDPRWQWAYRAKIVATHDSPDTALFTDATLLHLNRKYPLLFSSVEAVTLRLMGSPEQVASLRAIAFFYFLSFLLLLASFPSGDGNRAANIATILVVVTIPKLLALGLDEVYVDFPLGVTALLSVLWFTTTDTGPARTTAVFVAGTALGGLKAEGPMLAISLIASLLVCRPLKAGFVVTAKQVLPLIAGLAVALGLLAAGWRYIPPDVPMENVQFSDFSLAQLAANADRLPVVLQSYALNALDIRLFGLFFPLCLLAAFMPRPPLCFMPLAVTAGYLGMMVVPFALTQLPLDFHLRVVVPRMFFHIIPLLTLTVCGGLSVGWQQAREGLGQDGHDGQLAASDAGKC